MKLITKFTLWYMAVTTVVLLLGGIILFKAILYEIDNEAEVKLNIWIKATARQIGEGIPVENLQGINNISIAEIDYDKPLIAYQKSDSLGLFAPKLFGLDRKLTIGKSFKINGKHYYISTFNFIAEPDEIITGLNRSLIAIFLMLLVFVIAVSLLISKRIFLPFNKTLQAIRSFSLKQQKPLQLAHTRTAEFKELNHFLTKMTAKALEDYRTLKEFSENASHEIRTPLAVVRGKLELLSATPINAEQAAYISSMQNAVQKLASVNQSLILLTKLENQEYDPSERINFSQLTFDTLSSFQELLDMKSIDPETTIDDNVFLLINPYLADILLNNLLSNAIRHNVPGGFIRVHLTAKNLRIENTGNPPDVPPEELFKRFKKSNQSSDSTGLGLSIVKQICDINRFTISYSYENSLHVIDVGF